MGVVLGWIGQRIISADEVDRMDWQAASHA